MEKTDVSGPDALRSYVQQKYQDHRYFFRGECIDWSSTHSSLDRLQDSKQIPEDQWEVFDRRSLHIATVLDIVINARPVFPSANAACQYVGPGSLLDKNNQLTQACLVYAAFQHYGIPSPFLDLTEDLETALFFSSYPPDTKTDIAVMFLVDSKHEEIEKRIARMPESDLYLNSRYARQSAHGLCLRLGSGTRDVNYKLGENFRQLGGVIEKITFPWPANLRSIFHEQYKKKLLSITGDRLAEQVYDACSHGLDKERFDSIRVDEVFRQARNILCEYQ